MSWIKETDDGEIETISRAISSSSNPYINAARIKVLEKNMSRSEVSEGYITDDDESIAETVFSSRSKNKDRVETVADAEDFLLEDDSDSSHSINIEYYYKQENLLSSSSSSEEGSESDSEVPTLSKEYEYRYDDESEDEDLGSQYDPKTNKLKPGVIANDWARRVMKIHTAKIWPGCDRAEYRCPRASFLHCPKGGACTTTYCRRRTPGRFLHCPVTHMHGTFLWKIPLRVRYVRTFNTWRRPSFFKDRPFKRKYKLCKACDKLHFTHHKNYDEHYWDYVNYKTYKGQNVFGKTWPEWAKDFDAKVTMEKLFLNRAKSAKNRKKINKKGNLRKVNSTKRFFPKADRKPIDSDSSKFTTKNSAREENENDDQVPVVPKTEPCVLEIEDLTPLVVPNQKNDVKSISSDGSFTARNGRIPFPLITARPFTPPPLSKTFGRRDSPRITIFAATEKSSDRKKATVEKKFNHMLKTYGNSNAKSFKHIHKKSNSDQFNVQPKVPKHTIKKQSTNRPRELPFMPNRTPRSKTHINRLSGTTSMKCKEDIFRSTQSNDVVEKESSIGSNNFCQAKRKSINDPSAVVKIHKELKEPVEKSDSEETESESTFEDENAAYRDENGNFDDEKFRRSVIRMLSSRGSREIRSRGSKKIRPKVSRKALKKSVMNHEQKKLEGINLARMPNIFEEQKETSVRNSNNQSKDSHDYLDLASDYKSRDLHQRSKTNTKPALHKKNVLKNAKPSKLQVGPVKNSKVIKLHGSGDPYKNIKSKVDSKAPACSRRRTNQTRKKTADKANAKKQRLSCEVRDRMSTLMKKIGIELERLKDTPYLSLPDELRL